MFIEPIFFLLVLIFSVVIHEVSHGYAALWLGDRTAQDAGRLTLNPIPHIDMFGSVLLPFFLVILQSPFLIGWAKPVPYNPYNLHDQKWGSAIVGVAGPLANIGLALVFGLLLRFLPLFADGASGAFVLNFMTIASTIAFLNLVLAFFNLVPIPPLDGSKVLFSILPHQWRNIQFFLEQYGIFLLLIFIFFFAQWILPIVFFFFRLISGTFPLL